MNTNRLKRICTALLAVGVLSITNSCSGGESANSNEQSGETGLTDFQLEHGIGPVTSPVVLDEIDPDLAEKGQEIFGIKCSACHKMDERYVGPPLGEVTENRTPAYIMNMILNPGEMIEEHPEAKKMFAEYMTPMAFQNVSEEEARAIVEYLRTENN